eukprot:293046-Prymnesium_polylepis.1
MLSLATLVQISSSKAPTVPARRSTPGSGLRESTYPSAGVRQRPPCIQLVQSGLDQRAGSALFRPQWTPMPSTRTTAAFSAGSAPG